SGGAEETHDGYPLSHVSAIVADGLLPGRDPTALLERLQRDAPEARTSALIRLYYTALRIRELEQRDAPVGQWWPVVEPYLRGIERANFAQRESEFMDSLTRLYGGL